MFLTEYDQEKVLERGKKEVMSMMNMNSDQKWQYGMMLADVK